MEEKIESKINEIIEYIISKKAEEITYSDYKILDCRIKDIVYKKEQEKRNTEMVSLMTKAFSGIGNISTLPEPNIQED